MVRLFFLVKTFLLLTAHLATCESSKLSCEATPGQEHTYNNSISLFCQEYEFVENDTDSQQPVMFPDLIQALKGAVFKPYVDDYEYAQGTVDDQAAANQSIDPKNVTDLTVWAKFDQIPADVFSQFPNLRQLYVAQFYDNVSRAVIIDKNAFGGLPNLQSLGLHVNFSQATLPEVLKLNNLTSLSLYEPNLKLELEVGKNWPRLSYLTIYDSPNMTFADDAFENLIDTLNEIDFANVGMDRLPKSISDLRNLTRIDIENTGLKEIPPEAFAKSTSTLRVVRLSRNFISVLHPTSFRALSNLVVLQLAYNKIDVIPATFFDDLTKLEVLNLYGNNIATLPDTIFNKNPSLHILDLDENPIQTTGIDFLKRHGHDTGKRGSSSSSSGEKPTQHGSSNHSKSSSSEQIDGNERNHNKTSKEKAGNYSSESESDEFKNGTGSGENGTKVDSSSSESKSNETSSSSEENSSLGSGGQSSEARNASHSTSDHANGQQHSSDNSKAQHPKVEKSTASIASISVIFYAFTAMQIFTVWA